jgi:hypothetical protein
VLVSGGGQEATVVTQLGSPLVVRVEDNYNNPVANATAHFVAKATSGTLGSVGAANVLTNAAGEAQTTFTLGTLAGATAQWVEVTVNDFPSVTTLSIPVSAEPDEPANIEIVSGNNQTASYGQTLAQPLVVSLEDQYGNPVWDYPVAWSSSTGLVAEAVNFTDSTGLASNAGTLGTTPGVTNQEFTAEANGLNVDFAATATGHYIQLIEPWKVWPGYPEPFAADPSVHELEVTIRGAGFEGGALVVWDVGGADEEVVTPDSVTATQIVFRLTGDYFVDPGTHPVAVRNPGPSDCASYEFTVGYMIPDTGQTWCTDASNQQVACATIPSGDPLYGQDGHYVQSLFGQHFYTDHGNGTVTDAITGLMWEQVFSAEGMPWSDALAYCEASTTGGYNDWRLPEIVELSTLVDAGSYNPSIDAMTFSSTPSEAFCSSSFNASGSNSAWGVYFSIGGINNSGSNSRVRCVRNGPLELGRFDALALSGYRVVIDRQTGLGWQGCTRGQAGISCSGTATTSTLPQALTYCEGLSWGGYDDWRLPSRNELQSIVDYNSVSPSIDTDVFPLAPSGYFWSSSSRADSLDSVWVFDFDAGGMGSDQTSNVYWVRCVRSGL